MPSTHYFLNSILDHTLCGPGTSNQEPVYAQPNATYVALFTTAPTPSLPGTEVSGNGYARVLASYAGAASGATSNLLDVNYPTATGSWGTITHFGIYDALSGGNLLMYNSLAVQRQVLTGDQVKFPAGQLTVTGT